MGFSDGSFELQRCVFSLVVVKLVTINMKRDVRVLQNFFIICCCGFDGRNYVYTVALVSLSNIIV